MLSAVPSAKPATVPAAAPLEILPQVPNSLAALLTSNFPEPDQVLRDYPTLVSQPEPEDFVPISISGTTPSTMTHRVEVLLQYGEAKICQVMQDIKDLMLDPAACNCINLQFVVHCAIHNIQRKLSSPTCHQQQRAGRHDSNLQRDCTKIQLVVLPHVQTSQG